MTKTGTIYLDDGPVRIATADWRRVAYDRVDSWGAGGDFAQHSQAASRGELDVWWMAVREHHDGRVLVYGEAIAGVLGNVEDGYAGTVLDMPTRRVLVGALRRVWRSLRAPDSLLRGIIADLPTIAL